MNNKLIFIGPISKGYQPSSGGTMKNQLFLQRFSSLFEKIHTIDTEKWRKNPLVFFQLIFILSFVRHARVVISCEAMAPKLIKFLHFVRIQRDVVYWVIGSDVPRRIVAGELNPEHFKYLKCIVVQSPKMVENLNGVGLTNALYVPNSKPYYSIEERDRSQGPAKFVFVSRIVPEKGCDLIVDCVKRLNAEGYQGRFSVDFYGKIGDDYAFEQSIADIESIQYHGVLNLLDRNGYEELSQYDVFLFPTFYKGEGFPGSVIDAYIAGLPIIATDWHFNTDVVEDGKTGVIIPPQNAEELYHAMLAFVKDKSMINGMSHICNLKAKEYDFERVLSENTLVKVGLLNKGN